MHRYFLRSLDFSPRIMACLLHADVLLSVAHNRSAPTFII